MSAAMENPDKIRNFSIVAQVDAGKSTLSDSLLCHAGLISKKDAGEKRQTDTMKQEQDRGITIKSVGVTLCVEYQGENVIMNVVDSPGHVDFSAEVTAALRVTDGAIVLIDTVDGVKAQTRTVLVQALEERIQPVLVVNKIDKLFLSLKMTPNDIYDQFVKNVEDVNGVIELYQDPQMMALAKDQQVDPVRGNVVFATAYHTWGFSLKTFADMYGPKMKKSQAVMMKFLWKRENFCKYILEPLYVVLGCCQSHPEKYEGKSLDEVVAKLEIKVQKSDFELKGKELMRAVMGSWLPVAEAVVGMAFEHLPSPKVAQVYRAPLLYGGPQDMFYEAIRDCNPDGPLVIYVSKMVPTKDNSHFYAFGRVFAGTVTASKVKVLMNEHCPGGEGAGNKSKTYLCDSIQRVLVMMATRIEPVVGVRAGNIMALDGVDKTMIKSGTIVGDGVGDIMCYPLKNMSFSVSAVVQYSIKPKKAGDIAKFTEVLKKFVKSDPCLQYIFNKESSEHILAGAGELHLEVALEQLRTDFLKGIDFVVSEPIVPYCETVTTEGAICLAKSANKHNRLFVGAQPLPNEVVGDLESGVVGKDFRERAKHVCGLCELDDVKRVWAFAPDIEPTNVLTNETVGIAYLNETRDMICAGMVGTCEKGPLCEEPIRGVNFVLKDAKFHPDNVHRGDNQILPAVRNVVWASMLSASPKLVEPIFRVDISVPREKVAGVYAVMNKRRGMVKTITPEANNIMMNVEAEMPVAESFGFIEELRGETSGTGFASLVFSHWQLVPGDPLEDGSYANKILLQVRARKNKKIEIPKLEDYLDKL